MTRQNTRAGILTVLADGQWHTTKDVQDATGLAQSTVTSHLNLMTRYPHGSPLAERERRRSPERTDGRPPRLTGNDSERAKHVSIYHYRLRRPEEAR